MKKNEMLTNYDLIIDGLKRESEALYRITTSKLKYEPYAQAEILRVYDKKEDQEHILLKSYETIVIDYNLSTNILQCSGLYSMTTRKHISNFMSEVFKNKLDYYFIKDLVNNKNGIIELDF